MAVAVTSLKDPEAGDALETLIAARRSVDHSQRNGVLVAARGRHERARCCRCAGAAGDAGGLDARSWAASPRGLSPTDIAMNVVLPELDGRIVTRAISFKSSLEADADLEYASVHHEPDARSDRRM